MSNKLQVESLKRQLNRCKILIAVLVTKQGGSVKIMNRDIKDTTAWYLETEDIPGGMKLNVSEIDKGKFVSKHKGW